MSAPQGSQASISSPTSDLAQLLVDVAGLFVVELLASDGDLTSTDQVNIFLTSYSDELINTFHALLNEINALPKSHVKKKNMIKALGNKVNSIIDSAASGEYQEAKDKLTYDILAKTDGCSAGTERLDPRLCLPGRPECTHSLCF